MRRLATTLLLLAVCAAPALAVSQIRVTQVYGGGGGTSPLYNFDYIEIYNSGVTPVNIGGWQVEYGAPAGNWGPSASNIVPIPAGTILQPCQYYLIQTGATGTGGAALPVPADLVQASGPAIGQTNGKVAIFTAVNTNLARGSELAGTLVDKVAYGTSNCAEGTAAGALTNIQAVVRNSGGNVDTDNNSADFTVTSNPVPRNSQTLNAACRATPTRSSTWGSVKAIYR